MSLSYGEADYKKNRPEGHFEKCADYAVVHSAKIKTPPAGECLRAGMHSNLPVRELVPGPLFYLSVDGSENEKIYTVRHTDDFVQKGFAFLDSGDINAACSALIQNSVGIRANIGITAAMSERGSRQYYCFVRSLNQHISEEERSTISKAGCGLFLAACIQNGNCGRVQYLLENYDCAALLPDTSLFKINIKTDPAE